MGKGSGFIEGEATEPGVYSLDGADCRKNRASCELLPQPGIFKLGGSRSGRRRAPSVPTTDGRRSADHPVVEDEASIASFVSLYLKNAGYDVRAVTTGRALAQVAAEQPALIILDLMLPDLDGIEIAAACKTSDVPILMLTARDEDVDKIIGLEVGADDYLTKPFNPRELVARVKSVLRRSAPERRRDVEEELRHGDLVINAGRREVKVGEEEIQLPRRSSTCSGSCSTTAGSCSRVTSCSSGSGATPSRATRAPSTCTCASCGGSSARRRRS